MPTERVLVVDDDPAILTLCHRILEADGYEVVDAKRGEDALNKLEQETFDLLLTDIRLPGLNGLDVTQRLRERNSELTVVTMTGYSNMEMAIQALSLGVDEFLVKPFTPDSLRIHVLRALEKSRLRRENVRLRTLVPLLQTAQSFAAARTRDQVYQELFAAAKMLCRTDEMFLLDAAQNRGMVALNVAPGATLWGSEERSVTQTEWNQLAMFFEGRVQAWNEGIQPRLPFLLSAPQWMVGAPLLAHTELSGILMVVVQDAPTTADLEALRLVSAQAAAALENVELLGEISHAYIGVRQVDQLKTEFLNIAAHELRTPLVAMRENATRLHDTLADQQRAQAQQVLQSIDRLQQIADDMLNLKYLEAGEVDLRPELCAVDEVVQQVVNSYRTLALEREQSIELAVEQASGSLKADRVMLDLILGSLLSNAIKYSPRKSHLRVAASGDIQHVTLSVQDQGKGLTPEQQKHVFDAFYRAGSVVAGQESGLGLGLTLARKMVDAHGGKIWVESESNAGSCFFISLPRETRAEVN